MSAVELSLDFVQELYESLTKPIVVEKSLPIDAKDRIREAGEGWSAIATTISGVVLHDLWQEYHNDLFSANIRGFLDMLNRKSSINRGISETVLQNPNRFWAYNNGVTALTKKITEKNGKIIIEGISVINGAQTTGVLGKAPRDFADKVRVPIRFIECADSKIVADIIQFNNTQNAIRSFDFRSNDPAQLQLRSGFKRFQIEYVHRREGANRLPDGAIQAETVAPALAAFHGKFQVATRQRDSIFEDNSTYQAVFPREVSCEHVYLVQCLADALNELKIDLQNSVDRGSPTDPERAIAEFLGYSTSKLFLIGIIGKLASSILGQKIPSLFSWRVEAPYIKPARQDVILRWKSVVEGIAPLVVHEATEDAYSTVRSSDRLDEVAKKIGFQLQALRRGFESVFSPIRDATDVK